MRLVIARSLLLLVPALMAGLPTASGQQPIPPTGSGPVAQAHTRTWRHRRSTVRMIRRTPAVMQEDAARIKRGDLFSSWSSAAAGSR